MAAPLTSLTPRECSHNRGVHNHSQVPSHIWGVGTSKVVKRLQTRNFAVIDPSQMTLVADLADLDPASAGIIAAVLKPTLSIGSLLMIVRIVMTWYPEVDATKFPWSIAYTPTGTCIACCFCAKSLVEEALLEETFVLLQNLSYPPLGKSLSRSTALTFLL